MKCDVAVTFEYATRPPQTVRLTAIEATGPQTIAARGIREARRQARPVNWTSISVLLLRLDAVDNPEETETGEIEAEIDAEAEGGAD